MKKTSIFYIILLIVILIPVNGENNKKLIIRVTDFAPYFFVKNGKLRGINIDYFKALSKEMKVEIEFRDIPWSRALKLLESGECDIVSNMFRRPDREKYAHFVGPYWIEETVLVVHKKNKNLLITNYDELITACRKTKLKIGIQQDVAYEKRLDNRLKTDKEFAKNFNIYVDLKKLPKLVSNNRLFGFFDDKIYISYARKIYPDYKNVRPHDFVIGKEAVYLGVSKKIDKIMLEKIRAAVIKLEKEGVYKKIYKRWCE